MGEFLPQMNHFTALALDSPKKNQVGHAHSTQPLTTALQNGTKVESFLMHKTLREFYIASQTYSL